MDKVYPLIEMGATYIEKFNYSYGCDNDFRTEI